MKKTVAFVLAFIFACSFSISSYAEEERYYDAETGVSFSVPVGWDVVPGNYNDSTIKVKYVPASNSSSSLAYFVIDYYTLAQLSDFGYSRDDINFLNNELVTTLMGQIEDMEVKSSQDKQYGNYQFKVVSTSMRTESFGLTLLLDCEFALMMVKGYLVVFQFTTPNTNEYEKYHPDFEELLSSVQCSKEERYYDTETGISFLIPVDAKRVPNEDPTVKVQYLLPGNGAQLSVAYLVIDYYTLTGLSNMGYSRSQINTLDDELMDELAGQFDIMSSKDEQYGNYHFKIISTKLDIQKYGLILSTDCEFAIMMVNGYVIMFQYMASNANEFEKNQPVFEDLLTSIRIE